MVVKTNKLCRVTFTSTLSPLLINQDTQVEMTYLLKWRRENCMNLSGRFLSIPYDCLLSYLCLSVAIYLVQPNDYTIQRGQLFAQRIGAKLMVAIESSDFWRLSDKNQIKKTNQIAPKRKSGVPGIRDESKLLNKQRSKSLWNENKLRK